MTTTELQKTLLRILAKEKLTVAQSAWLFNFLLNGGEKCLNGMK